jgi:hypothetical protein
MAKRLSKPKAVSTGAVAKRKGESLVLIVQIEPLILTIRDQKVLLDRDLAVLYGVPTKRLNEQVQRNAKRFPPDFMFQLTKEEFENWRSQIATSNSAAKMGLRRQPYAFTEHGAIMAATILNSPRAVEVSVFVVRAFVKLREIVRTHKELAHQLDQLEIKVAGHDDSIRQLVGAIRQLMAPPPETKRRKIGFLREE